MDRSTQEAAVRAVAVFPAERSMRVTVVSSAEPR
jgi:hypothetical protein